MKHESEGGGVTFVGVSHPEDTEDLVFLGPVAAVMEPGLVLSVWGLGFRVKGLGFRVKDLGFGDLVLGFRV